MHVQETQEKKIKLVNKMSIKKPDGKHVHVKNMSEA